MKVRASDAIDGGGGFEDDAPHPAITPPPITSTQAQTTERSTGSLYASPVIVVTQHSPGRASSRLRAGSASARAAARRGGSTRARSRRSCARRSPRRGARASRAPSASPSGSTRRSPSPRAGRRARGPARAEQAVPAPRTAAPTLEVPRARDVPLARVALVAAASRVLVRRPHVEDRQRRIVEPARKLLPRRECLRIRLESASASRTGSSSTAPSSRSPSQPAMPPRRIATLRMPRELGHLRRRHRADAVAAVDEHEPLAARDPVPPQPQRDLLRERARRFLVRRRRRRAEHERPRARDVAAHVRVRAADVADDEIVLAEMLREPPGVDDRLHSAATIPASAAIAGRCSSRASQSESDGKRSSSTPSMSRARSIHGHEGDVREPVLRAAEVRPLAEQRVEPPSAASNCLRARRPPRAGGRSTDRSARRRGR